jgi:hypothetical protein
VPAYLIVQIEWRDRGQAMEHGEQQAQLLRKYGSRTLYVGAPRVLEGNWDPPGVVPLERIYSLAPAPTAMGPGDPHCGRRGFRLI